MSAAPRRARLRAGGAQARRAHPARRRSTSPAWPSGVAEILDDGPRRAATTPWSRARGASTGPTSPTTACACPPAALERARRPAWTTTCARRSASPPPRCAMVAEALLPDDRARDAAPGPARSRCARVPGRRGRRLRAGRPRRLPLEPGHGRACRRRWPAWSGSSSSARPGRTAARAGRSSPLRRCCGVEEVYAAGGAAGDRRARLRHRDDRPGRRDRRARATPRCRRPSARSSARSGIDGIAGPSELMVIADAPADPARDRARPARPGRARRRLARRCWPATTRERRSTPWPRQLRGLPEAIGPITLVECASMPLAIELAEAFAPEHLEIATRDAEAIASRDHTVGGGLRRAQRRDRVRRLRRRLQPRPAHRGRRALRVGPRPHNVPAEDVRGRR